MRWMKLGEAEENCTMRRSVKSRRIRWAMHVARMIEKKLSEEPEGREHLEDLGLDIAGYLREPTYGVD